MDGDHCVQIFHTFPNTSMAIEERVLHPTPHLDLELTKDLETTNSPYKEQELKELEDESKSKEINQVLDIASCTPEEVLDAGGKSQEIAEVANIENKNNSDEMILEGDMQAEVQVFTSMEKKTGGYFQLNLSILLIEHLLNKLILCIVGGREFDDGSNAATIHPHLEELQPHLSTQKSDTCGRESNDGFNGATIDQRLEELQLHPSTQKSRVLGSLYYFVRSGDNLVFESSPMSTSIQLLLGDILLDEYGSMKCYYI